jgi:hypothetical protein
MKKIFVFWDNSNIFISAKAVAAEREGGDAAYTEDQAGAIRRAQTLDLAKRKMTQ